MDPALISVAFGNSVGIAVSFSLRFLDGKPISCVSSTDVS